MTSNETLIERLAKMLSQQARGDREWQEYVVPARELISAMRAPTMFMAKAGSDIPVGCCMTNSSDAGEVWEYMIDAALIEPPAA